MVDKFEKICHIGRGSFGEVYKAKNKITNELVAIKKFSKKYHSLEKCKELREVKSLTKLEHDNIIKLYDVILEENTLYLVFELMDQNLYDLLNSKSMENEDFMGIAKRKKGLDERLVKKIIHQTLSGLAYIHKHGYFHRDLKPENILIDKFSQIKLADFGLAREIRSIPPYTQYVSTRWYRAPECLLESTSYSYPIDIWAVGCICYELLTGDPLFPGSNQKDTLMRINSLLGPPSKGSDIEKLSRKCDYKFPSISNNAKIEMQNLLPQGVSKEASDFILSVLKWEPSSRPTSAALLMIPYFQGLEVSVNKEEFDLDKILDNSIDFNQRK